MKRVYGTLVHNNKFVVDYFIKVAVEKIPAKYEIKEMSYGTLISFNGVSGIFNHGDTHVVMCLNNVPATEEKY